MTVRNILARRVCVHDVTYRRCVYSSRLRVHKYVLLSQVSSLVISYLTNGVQWGDLIFACHVNGSTLAPGQVRRANALHHL